MSVSSVITSLTSQIATLLGNDWKELKYVYEVEKNDFRNQKNGYGVGFAGNTTVAGTTKAVTKDNELFVVLTKQFGNRASDSSERTAILELLDKKDILDKNIFEKKLNNSSVLVVQEIGTEAPESVADSVVALRFTYVVKTRTQTT